MIQLAAGLPFLQGLLARPALAAAATYGPLLLQAASQLNAGNGDTGDQLGAAGGNLALGLAGVPLGALAGRGLGRSARYRMGPASDPDIGAINRAGRRGGMIGGALGALALGGAGAGIGRGVTDFMQGSPEQQALRSQLNQQQQIFESQLQAQEAALPLQRKQQQLALDGYREQSRINSLNDGLTAYRNAVYGAALGSPASSNDGFSQLLAQYALGGGIG